MAWLRWAVTGALLTGCGDDSGGGTGSGGSSEAETGAAPMCGACEELCFEGECLPEPELLLMLDAGAESLQVIDGGIGYKVDNTFNAHPFDGAREVVADFGDESLLSVWFEGDVVYYALRSPERLFVHDRGSGEATLLGEVDDPVEIVGVMDGAVIARSNADLYRFETDGSGHASIAAGGEAAAVNDQAIYVLQRTSDNTGPVKAFDARGANERDIGTWAGFPVWVYASGDRVAWWGREFFEEGDNAIRLVTDDGVTSNPPVQEACPNASTEDVAFSSQSMLLAGFAAATISVCALDGTEPARIWNQGVGRVVFVRGDATLVGLVDNTGAVAVYRFSWPSG